MDSQILSLQKQINDLEDVEEYENDIFQTFQSIEEELAMLLEMYNEHDVKHNDEFFEEPEDIQLVRRLQKKLKRIKDDADLYDEEAELNMMFPDGIPDEY